ncbi:palmdelphin [Electrophorus electricus]|uniref:palmdelphin n=1 Tax=Electrophorus electricus TaxID=8005 RepID=UPI0015D0A606|nr:palmdelphin [Electrophorus electricus]
MEETELVKVRLQAITSKRRIQEDIALKRQEIDREKLKLQHLKKKSMRDLWLMGDTRSANVQEVQKAQEVVQQTKLLQSNIHRIEKEIEALEQEELNISTNEGLILKRLKSIEKSTEEIIKAANANFNSETAPVYTGNPEMGKLYTSLNLKKQPTPDSGAQTDQHKPALFAMEINVQKDLRTGQSHVLSFSTVSPQELQQRGIKVYDDGRKSVFALRSDASQRSGNGVAELSAREVEDLLKQATKMKKRPQGHSSEPSSPMNYSCSLVHSMPHIHHASHHTSGCPEPFVVDKTTWPELRRDRGVQYPGQELHGPAHMFQPYDGETQFYHINNGNSHGHEMYRAGPRHGCGPCYDLRDTQRGALCVDPDMTNWPPSSCSDNSKPSILNTLPSDEPVTMIFMGYQPTDNDHQSSKGSIRAELVVIGEGEEDPSPCAASYHHSSVGLHQNRNTNNTTPRQDSEGALSNPPATASWMDTRTQEQSTWSLGDQL